MQNWAVWPSDFAVLEQLLGLKNPNYNNISHYSEVKKQTDKILSCFTLFHSFHNRFYDQFKSPVSAALFIQMLQADSLVWSESMYAMCLMSMCCCSE